MPAKNAKKVMGSYFHPHLPPSENNRVYLRGVIKRVELVNSIQKSKSYRMTLVVGEGLEKKIKNKDTKVTEEFWSGEMFTVMYPANTPFTDYSMVLPNRVVHVWGKLSVGLIHADTVYAYREPVVKYFDIEKKGK